MKALLDTVSVTATFALLAPATASAAEITDPGTQRDGMHACPVGQAMTGAHVDTNVVLCNTSAGPLGTEPVDPPVYLLEWIWITPRVPRAVRHDRDRGQPDQLPLRWVRPVLSSNVLSLAALQLSLLFNTHQQVRPTP
jgi:hypothetical protein